VAAAFAMFLSTPSMTTFLPEFSIDVAVALNRSPATGKITSAPWAIWLSEIAPATVLSEKPPTKSPVAFAGF
jgi:hypothetical protein